MKPLGYAIMMLPEFGNLSCLKYLVLHHQVFKGLNLSIPAGARVALAGPSGSVLHWLP